MSLLKEVKNSKIKAECDCQHDGRNIFIVLTKYYLNHAVIFHLVLSSTFKKRLEAHIGRYFYHFFSTNTLQGGYLSHPCSL